MKPAHLAHITLTACLALCLALGGCAYTTVTSKLPEPEPGPLVTTDVKAKMPPVVDNRSWPETAGEEPIPLVRIFAPEMTQSLREDLAQKGLFAALVAPDQPGAAALKDTLLVQVNSFELANAGSNAWIFPHIIMDGLVLPAFAVAAVGSGGEIDLGGYTFPSSRMATNLGASVSLSEEGLETPILERSYLVSIPLEAISDRELRQSLSDPSSYGVSVGQSQGRAALKALAETAARDPYWAFLPQYRLLAWSQARAPELKAFDAKARLAADLMELVQPLAYIPDEARVLRDAYLAPGVRASIVNDMRARWWGLEDPQELPAGQRLDAAGAESLFDDPAVARALVQAEVINAALRLAVQQLTPPAPPEKAAPAGPLAVLTAPSPAKGTKAGPSRRGAGPQTPAIPPALAAPTAEEEEEGAGQALTPEQEARRQSLLTALGRRFQGQARLQLLLIDQADQAVGATWPVMQALLKAAGEPFATEYLANREQ